MQAYHLCDGPHALRVQGKYAALIAGNTGAGVYHAWPTARVLIATANVPEFRAITCSEVQ